MMLYQFDTLLKGYLGENFGINEGFILNSHPETSSAIKYMIKQSKKHQRMGWETSGDEDSESHTGITTKNILNNIFLYNYKNPS